MIAVLYRFVAISDLYEPTDDGTESQVKSFFPFSYANFSNELKRS